MARIKICKEPDCHNAQTTQGYCRLHYLKNWKDMKASAKEKAARRLNRYIEAVCRQHPDKFVEIVKKDIKSKTFEKFIDEHFNEVDDLYRLFSESTYEDDIDQLLHDLKMEKDF